MNNKENNLYQNLLENPNLSEAPDKIIQESRGRLKQKRCYHNKNDYDQTCNRGNDQNDNTNSDDCSCYDHIISSFE